jgi:hypothetical protein
MASTSLLYRFRGNLSREIPKSLFLIICPETGAENQGIFPQKKARIPCGPGLLVKTTKMTRKFLVDKPPEILYLIPQQQNNKTR